MKNQLRIKTILYIGQKSQVVCLEKKIIKIDFTFALLQRGVG